MHLLLIYEAPGVDYRQQHCPSSRVVTRMQSVTFMAAPRMTALSHREPDSAGTLRGSSRTEDSDKRYEPNYVVYGYSAVVKTGTR